MNKDDLNRKKKFWDLRSNEFFNISKNTKSINEANKIIEYLKNKDILNKDSEVLDIGCGTGRHTIPLAKHVKKVVAIDISSEMIKLGKKFADSEGVKNIEWIEVPFENLRYNDKRFEGKFDLVFAHNSGAITDDESIRKLINFTKRAFYIKGFLKRRHYYLELSREKFFPNSIQEDIEEKIALESLMEFIKEKNFKNEISTKEHTMEKIFSLEKISQLYSHFLSKDDESALKNNKIIYEFLKPYYKNNEFIEKTAIESVSIYCEINNELT